MFPDFGNHAGDIFCLKSCEMGRYWPPASSHLIGLNQFLSQYDRPKSVHKISSETASNSGRLSFIFRQFHGYQLTGRMTDRTQPYTTPPTSPLGTFVGPKSPSSPRSFHTFPLVPPPPLGTHPRHPTRHVATTTQFPLPPATLELAYSQGKRTTRKALLELVDGSSYTGFSFGAAKSASGELVFQTGNNSFPDFKFHPKHR